MYRRNEELFINAWKHFQNSYKNCDFKQNYEKI